MPVMGNGRIRIRIRRKVRVRVREVVCSTSQEAPQEFAESRRWRNTALFIGQDGGECGVG